MTEIKNSDDLTRFLISTLDEIYGFSSEVDCAEEITSYLETVYDELWRQINPYFGGKINK